MNPEIILADRESRCLLFTGLFQNESTEQWIAALPWRQNEIRMFGKTHPEPRLTTWMGPAYRYASIEWSKAPFTSEMRRLMEAIERQATPDNSYNAVLANLYRDGQDAMGWHRDNERSIDKQSIASVSFGGTRDFLIRHRASGEKWTVPLQHGDVLIMESMQDDFEHSIPRRKQANAPRINLTFRHILTS
tara:strand:+ start:1679 stop:2248 length:570 start_codon:yes stop_codon:yes gene_type:complete